MRGLLLGLTLLFLLTGRVAAQNVLLALQDGKPYQVVEARNNRPIVEIDGKRIEADWHRLALRKVDEFLPVFISIHGLKVGSWHVNAMGKQINNEWRFQARFESAYQLDDVFLVLEMKTESGETPLFLYEVGPLQPHGQKSINLTVPLGFPMGKGRYQLHLFAGGREVFHSEIPEARREAVVDRMVVKRIAALQDADPKPFIGPTPEYPSELLKGSPDGEENRPFHIRFG